MLHTLNQPGIVNISQLLTSITAPILNTDNKGMGKKGAEGMREYIVANILDLLETIGEDKVSFALSEFSCPRNAEIEEFIHNNAIDFAKKKMSITYLVFDEEGQIEAFFTCLLLK